MRSLVSRSVLVASVLAGTQVQSQQPANPSAAPVTVTDYREVASHHLGSTNPIRVLEQLSIFESIELSMTVDASGQVLAAEAIRGPAEFRDAAIAEAKTWTYKPFQRNGKAVLAKFTHFVRLLPPEKLPKVHVPFPEIRDWNSLRMTLRRSACFGACPVYSVEISGDGSVVYTGTTHVLATGEQHSQISQDAVAEILEAFRQADYFSLENEYLYAVTDCPTHVTSISFDGHSKSVTDYVGEYAEMPHAVEELEMTIDRLAGTDQWILGSVVTGTKP
jgi:hypothetical protein